MSNTLEYRVESTTLINFRYKKPILSINEDGEIVSTHRKNDKGVLIKSVTLLNIIGYDDKGCIKDFEPIVEVNQFILSKHIDDNNLESGQLSQGLAHYFDFILAHQARWDKAYDVKTFDPDYDEARPSWDHFPLRKVDRYYTVIISPNLFGEIVLQTIYGRNGTRGQKRTYTFSSHQECMLKLNEVLRKRLNARGRLGTNYSIVDHTFDAEFKRDILSPLSLKETKDSPFKEVLLNLKSKND